MSRRAGLHHFQVLVAILLCAGIFIPLASAVDDDGPDTSGYDLDIDGFVTEFLDDPFNALMMGAPGYQWNAERHMDEGDRCAVKYNEYHTKFLDRSYIVYQQLGQKQEYTPTDKKSFSDFIFRDPDSTVLGSIILTEKDPEAVKHYNAMNVFGDCIIKNYDAAMNKIKDDDYSGKGAVWERAAGMYQTIGNDQRAQESHKKADQYRQAANTKSLLDALFEPLPSWLAVLGVIGGLFLLHRRRE